MSFRDKPVLVTGLLLSLFWVVGDRVSHVFSQWSEIILLLCLGVGVFWWKRQEKSQFTPPLSLSSVSRSTVKESLTQTQGLLRQLQQESPLVEYTEFQNQICQLEQGFDRTELSLVITGGKGVGKSSLLTHFSGLTLTETPSLFQQEIPYPNLTQADFILFVINGDLTDSQWQFLRELKQNYHALWLIVNQFDRYPPSESEMILSQIQNRVKPLITETEIFTTTAVSTPLKVRKQQPDGTFQDSLETQTPQLNALPHLLSQFLTENQEKLVLNTLYRHAQYLQKEIKDTLNQVREIKTIPVIESYQWMSAITAFTNPISSLDILATTVINAQMFVDIAGIYQQKLSLNQSQAIAKSLGEFLVKFGLVELSSQAIIGLLKSNAITYVAGGVVQGVSSAYFTRLAGISFREYLQEYQPNLASQNALDFSQLGNKLKQVFQLNNRTDFLQGLIQQSLLKFHV